MIRSSNKAARGVMDINQGVSVAIILGQQLIIAVWILAAAGVLARHGDLLVRWIGRLTAGHLGRFIIGDCYRETAGVGVARSIDCRARDSSGSRWEHRS